jgi:hypothetical protein
MRPVVMPVSFRGWWDRKLKYGTKKVPADIGVN